MCLHVQYIKCKGCLFLLFFSSNICRICFRCKWNGFDAIIVKTTQKMNFLPLYHTLLRNMIHFVLSIENQNYTKKQGALAIEQNVMKTLFLRMEKSSGIKDDISFREQEASGVLLILVLSSNDLSILHFWKVRQYTGLSFRVT